MNNIDKFEENQVSLLEILLAFWRGRKTIIAIMCVALIVSILITSLVMTPQYRAHTTIVINPIKVTPSPLLDRVTIIDPFDGMVSLTQDDFIFLINSDAVVQETIDRLDLNMEVFELSEAISVSKVLSTSYVEIAVQHSDPDLAVHIVNTLALVFQELIIDYHYQNYSEAQELLSAQLDEVQNTVQEKKQFLTTYEGQDIEQLILEIEAMKNQLRSDKDRQIFIEMQTGIDRAYVEMLDESDFADSTMLNEYFDISINPNASSSSHGNNYSINIGSDRLSDVMIRSDYISALLRLHRYEYEQAILVDRIQENETRIENAQKYLLENEDDYYSIKNDIFMAQTTVRAYQQRITELDAFNSPGAFDSIVSIISPSSAAPKTGPNLILNIAVSLVVGLLLGMFVVLTQQRLIDEGIIKTDIYKKKARKKT